MKVDYYPNTDDLLKIEQDMTHVEAVEVTDLEIRACLDGPENGNDGGFDDKFQAMLDSAQGYTFTTEKAAFLVIKIVKG